MEVASRCRIDVAMLRSSLSRPGARVAVAVPRDGAGRRLGTVRESPELEALRLALLRPADMAPHLDEVLFADELHLAAYRALVGSDTLPEALERADPAAADLLQRLAVQDTDADPGEVVVRLVEEATRRALGDLDADMRRSSEPEAYAPSIGWLKLRAEELRDPVAGPAAVEQLVAWLAARAEEGE
jgi:hypothetical protein